METVVIVLLVEKVLSRAPQRRELSETQHKLPRLLLFLEH